MGGKKLTGWGKNGPAYFFPGERMGRPILSPGKKLTGGKFRPVTPGLAGIKTYAQKMQDAQVTKSLMRHFCCCPIVPAIVRLYQLSDQRQSSEDLSRFLSYFRDIIVLKHILNNIYMSFETLHCTTCHVQRKS